MKLRVSLFILIILTSISIKSQSLFINEIMSSNSSILPDKSGNFDDWIEIYNSSDLPVQLQNYYLSDDENNLMKWKFPSIEINAKGYQIVFASGKNIVESGNYHTNFKLSNGNEPVILTAPDGLTIVDKINPTNLSQDASYGRQPDGSSKLFFFETPTPDSTNNTKAYKKISQPPVISLSGGFYTSNQKTAITVSQPNTMIVYTINGSFPSLKLDSTVLNEYKKEINIDSSIVIRARAMEDSAIASIDVSNTYLINVITKLPVISIATDPDNFFGATNGIYVDKGIKFKRDWLRPVNIQMYESDKKLIFNTSANVKLFGRTAIYYPEKTLAVYFTGPNNEIDYKLFEDKPLTKFKSILLRNSSDDWYRTMFRDGLQHTLVNNHSNVDLMAYRPSIVFINGKYWGIHNLREKVNEDYIAGNHNVNRDSIDMMYIYFRDSLNITTELKSGDSIVFYQLLDYIKKTDFKISSNFNYISSKIDIDNLLDLEVIESFVSNASWDHNCKMWKTKDKDCKWRSVMYDLDKGFGIYNTAIYDSTLVDIYNRNIIFKRLIKNTEFRNIFIQKMNAHLNSTFDISRCLSFVSRLQNDIADEMPNHIARWNGKCWVDKCGIPSMDYWNASVEKMRKFSNLRPEEMRKQMIKFFKLQDKRFYLNLAVEPSGTGTITVENVDVMSTNDKSKGSYFSDIPINLKAIAANGYHFIKWKELNGGGSQINVNNTKDITLTALFDKDSKLNNIYINEFCASNGSIIADEYNEYDDWIELYNGGSSSVDIGGLFITDDLKNPCKFQIPKTDPAKTTIPSKGFLILWADNQTPQGILHINFNLNKEGNDIGLAQIIGTDTSYIDSLTFKNQAKDITFGMYPDGSRNYEYFTQTTPGKSNKADNVQQKISGLYINEYLATNKKTVNDNFSQFDDCIEIYNSNTYAVDVAGLFITDSLPNPTKFQIPSTNPQLTTIPSKGFILIWADGTPAQGPLHLSFKLSASGEQIGIAQLYKDELNIIDTLSFKAQSTDISEGRCPDGGNKFIFNTKPTLGFTNKCDESVEDNYNEYLYSNLKTEPNPFSTNTKINVDIRNSANTEIFIYNSSGIKVRTLAKLNHGIGKHTFIWDGKNDRGTQLSNGLYLLMLHSDSATKSIKILKTN